MIFPLLKIWITPYLPNSFRSTNAKKAYRTPSNDFVKISGGGLSGRMRKGSQSAHMTGDNTTFVNDSEEQIVKGDGDVKMEHLECVGGTQRSSNAIVVSKKVSVTIGDRISESEHSAESFHRV